MGDTQEISFNNAKYKGHVKLTAGKNPLTGSWMYWWTSKVDHSCYVSTKKDIRNIVKNIRKKEKGRI